MNKTVIKKKEAFSESFLIVLIWNLLREKVQIKNKRPMGHIAHLRKQFKSINTIDYIITLIKRRKKTLLSLWELNGSSLNKIESHSPKHALCQVWLKFVQWFWRRRFFNFVNVFSLFRYYVPLEKGGANLNPLHRKMHFAKFGWNWLSGSGEDFF